MLTSYDLFNQLKDRLTGLTIHYNENLFTQINVDSNQNKINSIIIYRISDIDYSMNTILEIHFNTSKNQITQNIINIIKKITSHMHKFKPYLIFTIRDNDLIIADPDGAEIHDINNIDEALELISTHIDTTIVQKSV